MDKIVDKIVGLGVPGLVFFVVMSTTGVAGGAAIAVTLSTLGGPFGMLGGVAALALITLISQGLTEYGFEAILTAVMKKFKKQGKSKKKIIMEIESYPITRGLKDKIIAKF